VKKQIAFFDFDGTLTHKDSMFAIVKYVYGNWYFYWGMFLLLPTLIGFKLGLIDRQLTKEKYLHFFFAGMPVTTFQNYCDQFSEKIIPKMLRKEAYEKMKWHQQAGHEVVLVSASAENWLKPWCVSQDINCLASKLEIIQGNISGNLIGKNCHGDEKVSRILQEYNLDNYKEIYAYGDSSGDKPMLAIANQAFYQKFN
jgi:HAD superfamily hydrolase (TIGR01490 family)